MAKTHSGSCIISKNHPSLRGHFPGDPIVPGVVLLSHIQSIFQDWQPAYHVVELQQAKFLRPLRPELECSVILIEKRPNVIKFECRVAQNMIATGLLLVDKNK